MARSGTLEGMRSNVLDSIKGRKLGLSPEGYLQGQLTVREVVGNVTDGTTLLSTGAAPVLTNYGFTLVGSTLTSGSTGSSGTGGYFTIADPVPGVRKVLLCPSTAPAVVASTAALIGSTAGSTYSQVTIQQGGSVELLGISTALWRAINIAQVSTGGSATLVAFV